jgi:AdoMet-dependent heme synthase
MKGMGSHRTHGSNGFVFSHAPILIYWELTRACELACLHCRAEANAERDPSELSTEECRRVLEMVADFGESKPHLVLTGGNPLKRPDFFTLLEHGAKRGLRMSVAPSGTEGLTRDVLRSIRGAGVESISLSLDGPSAESHDGFRGVPGCFDWTVRAAHAARAEDLLLQINTLVITETERRLPELYEVVCRLDPMRWSLFFLIGVGRGRALQPVSPERSEALLNWFYDLSVKSPFAIATTEAPHFRRVATGRMRAEGIPMARIRGTPVGRGFGIRDGNGIMFVSHTGEVYPSGFLPLVAGNIRTENLSEIYRKSELFKSIRTTAELKGRCGVCEFREICGGSRARAFAAFGDCMAEDPACGYRPAAMTAAGESACG